MGRVTALAIILGCVTLAQATQYPVTPQVGEWLILVQSYTGEGSEKLAEDLATSLRTEYKPALPAYVFNRAEEERQKERERIRAIKQHREQLAQREGMPKDTKWEPIRTHKIEDSYAVMIGGWKDMETARKALEHIRKLKAPAQKFMHQGRYLAPPADGSKARDEVYGGLNPFLTAFVVHNPMLPTPVDPEKGKLQNLKEFNADESFSLLKCRKPWTLMVKTYTGAVRLASATDTKNSFVDKLTGTAKPGQILNASASQAHQLAEVLKQLRDDKKQMVVNTDVYVLHTETASYVCVGGFDRPDDPSLVQYQKRLANLNLGGLDVLNAKPMPMPVPKP